MEKLQQDAPPHHCTREAVLCVPRIQVSLCGTFWVRASASPTDGLPSVYQCYWRAYSVGDVERMALLKLAKWVFVDGVPARVLHSASAPSDSPTSPCSPRLHEQLNESDDAAQCYIIYIQDVYSCAVRLARAHTHTHVSGHPYIAAVVQRAYLRLAHVCERFLSYCLGALGARGGEHGPPVPGPVLLQKQTIRWGRPLRSAVLWLQWRECSAPP